MPGLGLWTLGSARIRRTVFAIHQHAVDTESKQMGAGAKPGQGGQGGGGGRVWGQGKEDGKGSGEERAISE